MVVARALGLKQPEASDGEKGQDADPEHALSHEEVLRERHVCSQHGACRHEQQEEEGDHKALMKNPVLAHDVLLLVLEDTDLHSPRELQLLQLHRRARRNGHTVLARIRAKSTFTSLKYANILLFYTKNTNFLLVSRNSPGKNFLNTGFQWNSLTYLGFFASSH